MESKPLIESHPLLDSLTSAVLLFDNKLRLVYINTAGEILFAVSARQLIGQKAKTIIRCSNALFDKNLGMLIDSEQALTEREVLLTLFDNREVTVDCTITAIYLDSAEPAYLFEIKQVDHQVRISREERLLNSNQAYRQLVRNLAHEIKNPLGGLRGAAQLLERELGSVELEEYTQIIIKEADRLQKLVDNMLGPNRPPKKQHVSIHQVLERVCQLVQAEAEDLRIIKDYDPSIPPVYGDMDQLIQAFLNIMRNSARAAGKDGVLGIKSRIKRQLTIGSQRHKHVVALEITDNGPGIPADLQEKIFYPMVSGQENGEGMGLGLSISQSLIGHHNGLIEFTSKPGRTVFIVLLPLELNDE